jgi:hypothetical protein
MDTQIFKIKYVKGPTTLNTRSGTFIVTGNNIKVVLDPHKNDSETILFDVNGSEKNLFQIRQ